MSVSGEHFMTTCSSPTFSFSWSDSDFHRLTPLYYLPYSFLFIYALSIDRSVWEFLKPQDSQSSLQSYWRIPWCSPAITMSGPSISDAPRSYIAHKVLIDLFLDCYRPGSAYCPSLSCVHCKSEFHYSATGFFSSGSWIPFPTPHRQP